MSIQLHYQHQYTGFNLDLSLELPASGISVVLGASGSGKTTLLRLIAGLEMPMAGRLSIGNTVWQNAVYSLPAHQRSVGFVFQDARLFPHLTVMQNIRYAQTRSQTRTNAPTANAPIAIEAAIELMQIEAVLNRSPHHLSGGERQRVAFVRALAAQPDILLMDEPLSSLDQALKAEILPYINRLKTLTPIPIIYVTHALAEAEALADYVVEIQHGRVLQAGASAALLAYIKAEVHWQHDMPLSAMEETLLHRFREKNPIEQQAILAQLHTE